MGDVKVNETLFLIYSTIYEIYRSWHFCLRSFFCRDSL